MEQIKYNLEQTKNHAQELQKEVGSLLSSVLWDLDNEIKRWREDTKSNMTKICVNIINLTEKIDNQIKEFENEYKFTNREPEETEKEEEIELPF